MTPPLKPTGERARTIFRTCLVKGRGGEARVRYDFHYWRIAAIISLVYAGRLSMSRDLIKTIQGKTDMRLILPFGLGLRQVTCQRGPRWRF